jgi:ATP-dependent protease ClpP protease subunit
MKDFIKSIVLMSAIVIGGMGLLGASLANLLTPSCEARWEGVIDDRMLNLVREDLEQALQSQCKVLEVELFSGGGTVVHSVEISQEMKRARQKGLAIEIHGRSFIASGAIIVLAAGSPGRRYIADRSFVLMHGVQTYNGYFSKPTCVDITVDTKDEEGKSLYRISEYIAEEIADSVNKPYSEVFQWFLCGQERAGGGRVLFDLGIVDHLE